jgi:hypothetical protein
VVGSPTHPVMPHLIMLWKMSPLWREVRAGARLWARGPVRRAELGRNWAQTEAQGGWLGRAGPAGWPLGGKARRPASGYFFIKKTYLL